ncbi:unnamed protein product (mitochondrion) [Plasmodiophora brassicae]|uniref:tRNA pseudouridine synthase n=1 Tax=Plasmodiophora brassicae TaxID=37360 RepID=A0A3P3YI72_PLABS|nr:unnamed protein product [Plasmodiophora brassicae]
MTRRNNRRVSVETERARLLQQPIEVLVERILRLESSQPIAPARPKKKSHRPFDWSSYTTRPVALRLAYNGAKYRGLAIQPNVDDTIEGQLRIALEKAHLVRSRNDIPRFSRCGRTDKGVSALENVVALDLRAPSDDSCLPIDYQAVLNRVLPPDIYCTGYAFVDDDFHARHHCLGRTYQYLFFADGMDIEAMQVAANKFVGTHDFRNFCRMSVVSCHNFVRTIDGVRVGPVDEHADHIDAGRSNAAHPYDRMMALTVNARCFLYNQIRCMMAILLLVGRRLESPSIVDELLDVERYPRKPQYELAPEHPLILTRCVFDEKMANFRSSSSLLTHRDLQFHLHAQWRIPRMQAAVRHVFWRHAMSIANAYCRDEEDDDDDENNGLHRVIQCEEVPRGRHGSRPRRHNQERLDERLRLAQSNHQRSLFYENPLL